MWLDNTHSTKFHDDWNASKITFVLHDQHLLTIAKQGSGMKGCAQPKSKSKSKFKSKFKSKKSESDADTSGGLSLVPLESTLIRTSASDPSQANMAQLLKNLFQGKVYGIDASLVYLMPLSS